MADLEISVVESERDFDELAELERLGGENFWYDKEIGGRCFSIGRVNNMPVSYWVGHLGDKEIFESDYLFVDERFRGKGYGNDLLKHQLGYAKSLGCRKVESVIIGNNNRSFAIQRKLGGELISSHGRVNKFEFDLTRLNL